MTDRLSFAVSGGSLTIPDRAPGIVFGPGGGAVPDWMTADRFTVVQGFAPETARLKRAGFNVLPEYQPSVTGCGLAVVVLPRARLRARLWIAQAVASLSPGGILVVEGAKTDGADAIWRECRQRLSDAGTETKAHGRVFWGRPADDFSDWLVQAVNLAPVDGMKVAVGVFSADAVDPGSAALADALPARLPPHVADLGAGWGWLSARILEREGVESLDMVEADYTALAAARENVTDPRARFHWADATQWRPEDPLDAVVMNPPFHTGRANDPSLGAAFIAAAAGALAPRGEVWLVANRHLPYEAHLKALFAEVKELPGPKAFKILHAARPRRTRG